MVNFTCSLVSMNYQKYLSLWKSLENKDKWQEVKVVETPRQFCFRAIILFLLSITYSQNLLFFLIEGIV